MAWKRLKAQNTTAQKCHPILNHVLFTFNGSHRKTFAGNVTLLPSDVKDFAIFAC